ncbi:MAG TPA: VCBS repeat-containing protein [Verrucomicrobiae bacterium]|nr:VCBS repeat-containing protein [Verrucomicrobiae bacterium]
MAILLALGIAGCSSDNHASEASKKKSTPKPSTNSIAAVTNTAPEFLLHSFKKIQISDKFWSEGANFGDFNRDGQMDIVSGPFWYEGPDFKKRHEYYPATKTFTRTKSDGTTETIPGFEGALGTKNTYSDNFFAFVYDFNGDGWPDILIYNFPGLDASWYENPKGTDGPWQRHMIFNQVDNESPAFTDINGDGKPDIVCNSGGYFGYATADWEHPEKPWKFHPITPSGGWQKFTHGLGVGDVNGDGRMDLLEKDGWWEQPASLANDPVWKFHPFPFAPERGGSQMYVYDVNGDGKNDVITAIAAHGYGLAWFEQTNTADGGITFIKHVILPEQTTKERPPPGRYGVQFSQLHSVALADVDGDGLMDIITGKRFWAHGHNGPDPDSDGPAVLYWFKLTRPAKGRAEFVPHMIDNYSGVGTQVVAGNISNSKYPDIVVGNKRGTFVFLHQTKAVSKMQWDAAQPKAASSAPMQ